jgi:N-acetylglucosaminyl-diphospho-decaprenol L-rhamnosyltransferase
MTAASEPAVTAVVVSHNTRGVLERCLGALARENARTIVVDTASSDGSVEFVRERMPGVRLVALSQNTGYGAAANRGAELVDSPFLLLLNADAWPLHNGVAALQAALESDPKLAVAAPLLLDEDGSVQRSVFGYPRSPLALAAWVAAPSLVSKLFRLWRALGVGVRARIGVVEPILTGDFPLGAALLIRMEAWDAAGGFDESFFMYSEETDLCERLRRLGWKIGLCAGGAFVHIGGASTSPVRAAMEREQLRSYIRFFSKHRGAEAAERARQLVSAALALRAVAAGRDERARQRELARWLRTTTLAALLK